VNALDVAARFRAAETNTAVRLGRVASAAISSAPYVFVGLSLAGEDATLHAVRFGRLGEAPIIDESVIDPRDRSAQYALFATIAAAFFNICEEARLEGTFPQIIVANESSAKHLSFLADRTLYLQDAQHATDAERERTGMVNIFGRYLSYFTMRAPIARQQALLSATRLLRATYVTGEAANDEDNLHVLRSWIEPLPIGVDPFEYRAAAAMRPSGKQTTTDVDRVLMRVLAELRTAEKMVPPDQVAASLARTAIRALLHETVEEIDGAVRWALEHLRALALPVMPHIKEACNAEHKAFESFMRSRDEGFHLRRHDTPRHAAIEYAYRTAEQGIADVGAMWYDPVMRARAVIDGRVLRGTITAVDMVAGTMTVRTVQPSLRARVGDRFFAIDQTAYTVARAIFTADGIDVVVNATPRIDAPQVGDRIDLLPNVPRFDDSVRSRNQAARRLAAPHWAYDEESLVTKGPVFTQPPDVLAALEKFA